MVSPKNELSIKKPTAPKTIKDQTSPLRNNTNNKQQQQNSTSSKQNAVANMNASPASKNDALESHARKEETSKEKTKKVQTRSIGIQVKMEPWDMNLSLNSPTERQTVSTNLRTTETEDESTHRIKNNDNKTARTS